MRLIRLVILVLIGTMLAAVLGVRHLEDTGWYTLAVGSLLAIGLYASTYGIVLKEAREHLRLILSAVTIGVLLKALLIGGSLAVVFHDPFYMILGIVVAQIDPLSVAALLKNSRMSAKAKTILASWASFDDPVTVLLALYVPTLLGRLFNDNSLVGVGGNNGGIGGYALGLGLNVLFIAVVWLLWRAVRNNRPAALVVLGGAVIAAVTQLWMLGVAGIGLFVRPGIEKYVEQAVTWALGAAAVVLGLLLVDGINILGGLALGVAAYCAQMVVGFLLTRHLDRQDRVHIACAQQNGITAIILSLLFEPHYPGTVAIVAPAIIVINGLHGLVNHWVDRRLAKEI